MNATDEEARLAALARCAILDTPSEESFDRVAELAATICATPIALVSLVDRDRQWFKARFCFEPHETSREVSFCAHAVALGDTLVVADAQLDPHFAQNPLVLSSPNIRFYAGAPIRSASGHILGTVCVIDQVPRSLSEDQRNALEVLSREVAAMLELRAANRELAALRARQQQLTAMLVHDLGSPLTFLMTSCHHLLGTPGLPTAAAASVRECIEAVGGVHRMTGNLLAIALDERGELVPKLEVVAIAGLLDDARRVLECIATITGHSLHVESAAALGELRTDAELIRRVLLNLGENALKYAPPGTTIRIVTDRDPNWLQVRVSDEGPGVPAAERVRIFDSFVRLDKDSASQARPGYGLGLAFCDVASRALGGRVWVEDNQPCGSTFVLELPA